MAERHLKLAFTLGFLSLAGPFAIDMYLPALPAIARELGVSVAAVQGSISGYFATFGIAQLVYGPLSDQLGRKRPIYLGMALFILGSLGAATAGSIEALIAWRAVQGAGASVAMVVPRAIVRDTGTGPAATRMMASIMLVISISPMVAPLAGSGVIALFGWRGVFVAMSGMAVLSVVLTATVLRETLAPENRVPVSLATMRRGMARLLRDPRFMGLSLTGGLGFSSLMVFIASAPFVYTGQYGLSPTGFSLAFAGNAIGFFSASQLAGPLGERFGGETVVRGGAGLFVAATLALTFSVAAGFAPFWLIFGALFVGNAGLGVVLPNVMVMALDDHGSIAGLASSFSGTVQMVTGGLAVVAAGPFFDGSALPMVASIAFCGLAVLVVSTLTLRRRRFA